METPLNKANLVVAGGASHGWSLWGAYTVLSRHYDFQEYAGTSIGACLCAVAAFDIAHYRAEAALRTLTTNNNVVDGKPLFRASRRPFIVRGGGLHDWLPVRRILTDLFAARTLGDSPRGLHIVVGDVERGRTVVMSSRSHPNVTVVDALCASTALWPVADAQPINGRLYVDGGWGNNVPTEVFTKSDLPSVVCHLATPVETTMPKTMSHIIDIAISCLNMAISDPGEIALRQQDIDVPVRSVGSGFDFSLEDNVIEARMMRGRIAAQAAQ